MANFALTRLIPQWYGAQYTVDPQVIPGAQAALSVATKGVVAIWAVQGALLGILLVLLTAFRRVYERFAAGTKTVSGALLATLNTASEYGFGGVIAAARLHRRQRRAQEHSQPAGQCRRLGLDAGRHHRLGLRRHEHRAGLSDTFIQAAQHMQIPLEVLHRVVAMASGGMDTLPHGAVITLLAVTGLSHRESYRDIFAVTLIKTLAVFVVIGVFYLTGLV